MKNVPLIFMMGGFFIHSCAKRALPLFWMYSRYIDLFFDVQLQRLCQNKIPRKVKTGLYE